MPVKIGKMENAGPYYGKSLEELEQLEELNTWSPEEERLLSRCCERIAENCHKQPMTPFERYKATFAGEERDRLLVEVFPMINYLPRLLDCFSESLKPIDCYQLPKLMVIANIAFVARYNPDILLCGPLSYGENLYGCDSRLIEFGNPVHIGEMPIKTEEDLEGLEVPDPTKHGFYPQYLWWIRETRRQFDKYGLSGVMPIQGSHCHGPDGFTAGHLLGYNQLMKAFRKQPELVKKTMYFATEWQKKLGVAVTNVGKVDYSYQCGSMGFVPHIPENLWIADEYAKIGQHIKANIPAENPIIYAWAMERCIDWLDTVYEKNVAGPGSFDGIMVTGDVWTHQKIYEFGLKHDMYASSAPSDKLLVKGPKEDIDAAIKSRCEAALAKPAKGNKTSISLGAIDYYTSPEHMDFSIERCKEHGTFH